MPKKMGRPKVAKKNALGEIFGVRLRPEEAKEVRDAISRSGERKPDWLRGALLRAAKKDLSERNLG